MTDEPMGSKIKYWCRLEHKRRNTWLFKYPRSNTGEHWAEKIGATLAGLMAMPHARVELATLNGDRGSVSESFLQDDQILIHGNQILDMTLDEYDHEMRFHQSNHTLENIFVAIETIFSNEYHVLKAKIQMGSYLVLDALIGNTDRHHENWGILCNRAGDDLGISLAPSYDHASALGRELMDRHRIRLLASNSVGKYSGRGRGAVYWSTAEQRAPSPLELVRRAVDRYPDVFGPSLMQLEDLVCEIGCQQTIVGTW